ncbi:MAG: 4-hydroxy-tetrahydrodipicolinate reductase [Desulfomonile tiedjei]|uniref:4-hydroxy-tetrahydrodipicolinate reductase n=1 Tax=Desulfomonile tiedjei TaxID=2358 RepID=A0A9D6V2Q8_9BACT|nr:4-hydroxy-tetrahydrodipicolinate reductase [Desulfomonile tiedjei]
MKIAVCGAAGRMGKRIIALAHEHPELEISGALESSAHPAQGSDVGELAGIGKLGVPITSDVKDVLKKCDLLVDFSSPGVSIANLKAAASLGKAIVVGTTGFSEEQKKEISECAEKTRCLVAPNMSMGVNLLFNLAAIVAEALGDSYDVEIIEAHHKLKKDAPSGTADKLAQVVAKALGRDLSQVGVYGRKGIVGERTAKEIGVMAVRGGDIVGDHTVMFITGGERIELIHRAHSRDALAKGALQAALWLYSQPPGLYDMQDVLGLKARK